MGDQDLCVHHRIRSNYNFLGKKGEVEMTRELQIMERKEGKVKVFQFGQLTQELGS